MQQFTIKSKLMLQVYLPTAAFTPTANAEYSCYNTNELVVMFHMNWPVIVATMSRKLILRYFRLIHYECTFTS